MLVVLVWITFRIKNDGLYHSNFVKTITGTCKILSSDSAKIDEVVTYIETVQSCDQFELMPQDFTTTYISGLEKNVFFFQPSSRFWGGG